jgi:hypothetical protein
MPFMTMNKSCFVGILLLINVSAFGQGGTLSSSPYSLFGLGVTNNLGSGRTNSLGFTGIAMSDPFLINATNPAALSTISHNQFLYDIGLKLQYGFLNEGNGDERRFAANFSNLSMAVKVTEGSAFGLSLKPKTDVGYFITGIERSIEGSNDTFISNIVGAGGINNLSLSYANSSLKTFRWGLSAQFLFGEITETESNFVSFSTLQIQDINTYRGFQFDFGLQYDLFKQTSLGLTFKTSSNLSGERERVIIQTGFDPIRDEQDLDSFDLPAEVGAGFSTLISDKILLNADYKRVFWDATDQRDQVGRFVDQNLLGLGLQYMIRPNGYKYWHRVQFRGGFQLDTGYLSVNNETINGYHITAGLGLPLGKLSNSRINIHYGFQRNGVISDGLFQENYHTLTVNFSFANRWFVKRRID